MTTPRDADRILRAWLDLMPDEAPDRTVAAVLQAVETTPQVRRPLVRAPWRSTPMTRFALIAAAAALGVAMIGGALYVGGLGDSAPPAPAATPSPSPTPTVAPSPVALDSVLRARWVAPMPAGADAITLGAEAGTLRFVVGGPGTTAWVEAGPTTGRSVPGGALQSGPDELTLTLNQAGSGCAAGDVGRYRWALDDGRTALTLTPVEDPCVARREALARDWSRSLVGSSSVPTGIVDVFEPAFEVTLADGFYAGRPMRDAIEITRGDNTYTFLAFKNPQAFVDGCSDERQEWAPGTRAFVDALKAHPALTDFAETDLEIGGYPALRVTYVARTDQPRCEPEDHPYYLWAPRDDPNALWWLSAGDPDLLYLVDHPDGTLMFQVLPINDPGTAAVMESIEFTDLLAAP